MSTGKGMRGHHSADADSVEWYTPPEVFHALGLWFDLDPCCPALPAASWVPALRRISLPADGLSEPWEGRVWLNPPYGTAGPVWLRKLAEHGDGVALIFASTETIWWQEVLPAASSVCFVRGRLNFVAEDGRRGVSNAGAGSALIGFGDTCGIAVAACGLGMTFQLYGAPLDNYQGALWG